MVARASQTPARKWIALEEFSSSPIEGMAGSDMLYDVGGDSTLLGLEYDAAARRVAD